MAHLLAALAAGLLFGAGLSVSAMINPAKVLAFLDLGAAPTGGWDPSLALVMGGAVTVALVGFALVRRRARPWLAETFAWPTATVVDRPLLIGAALFGLGWGLVGYCPGPALAGLTLGTSKTLWFIGAMLAGMALHRLVPGPWRRSVKP